MNSRQQIVQLQEGIFRSIIGPEHIVERLLICLLSNGSLLMEGLPGLAKTRSINRKFTTPKGERGSFAFNRALSSAI